MADKPLVSVIVPTKDSEVTISKCLESIRNQTYPNIEIIVVDNFSRDGTKEIAQKYGSVCVRGPERSSQRNLGSRNANGDYLFAVDSDMKLTSRVVEECIKEALIEKADAIIVPEVSVGEGFWAKCKILERSCYIGDENMEAARFFRKDVFFEVGGYDEELTGTEDWDLSLRIKKAGHKMGRINAFIEHNEGKLTLRQTMLKKHSYGKTLRRYRIKHPEEAKHQLRLTRSAFVKNRKRLFRHPIHAIGMFVMKTCEFAAGYTGSKE